MILLSKTKTHERRQDNALGFKGLLQAHLLALNTIRECMLAPMPQSLRMKVCGLQDLLLDTVQELFIAASTPGCLQEQNKCETKLNEIIDMIVETKCLIEQSSLPIGLVTNRTVWMLGVYKPADKFIVIG